MSLPDLRDTGQELTVPPRKAPSYGTINNVGAADIVPLDTGRPESTTGDQSANEEAEPTDETSLLLPSRPSAASLPDPSGDDVDSAVGRRKKPAASDVGDSPYVARRQSSIPDAARRRRSRLLSESRSPFATPPFTLPSAVGSSDALNGDGPARAAAGADGDGDGAVARPRTPLPPLTRRQCISLVMLAFANFCSTVVFSCIAPFFPQEAKMKGASATQTGIIFGVFELVILLTAPFFGRYISQIGSKFMYGMGLFVTGCTSLLFGLLAWSPPGTTFIVLALAVRIAEAVGDSMFLTASFTIIAHEFPGRVATTIGLLETFSGLGFTAGPPVGGALYQETALELGGFQLPFTVLGCLLLMASALSVPLISSYPDDSSGQSAGIMGLLRMPSVVLLMSAIVVCAASLSFLDPTLQPFLADFGMTPLSVGLVFLIISGVYTVTAPVWGMLVDRFAISRYVMIFGALVSALAMFFVYPSPLLGIQKNLWVIGASLFVLGLAIGALFTPTFVTISEIAAMNGYPETLETHGCISGLFQSCFSFGGFFGPTIGGGVLVEALGYGWTASIIAAMHICVGVGLIIYNVAYRKRFAAYHKKDSMVEPLLTPSVGSDSGYGNGRQC